jgi:hypothetical protein
MSPENARTVFPDYNNLFLQAQHVIPWQPSEYFHMLTPTKTPAVDTRSSKRPRQENQQLSKSYNNAKTQPILPAQVPSNFNVNMANDPRYQHLNSKSKSYNTNDRHYYTIRGHNTMPI